MNLYSKGDNLCVMDDSDCLVCYGSTYISEEEYETHYRTGLPPMTYCRHGKFMKGKNVDVSCIFSYQRTIGHYLCLNSEAENDFLTIKKMEEL